MQLSRYIIFTLCFAIYGCANQANQYMAQKTQAQFELERISEVLTSGKQKYSECRVLAKENKAVKTVNALLLEDDADPRKVDFLTNHQSLTKEYKIAIKDYFPITSKCRGIALEATAKAHQELAEVQANGFASFDLIMIDVINNQIKSVAELNRRYLEELRQYNTKWAEAERRIYAYLEKQHLAELQGRRVEIHQRQMATNMAIQNWMNSQQQLNNALIQQNYMNRSTKPSYTNCNVIGNTVNCSSY